MNTTPTRQPAPAAPTRFGRGRAALPNDPGLDALLADTRIGSTAKAIALALVKNWAWYKASCFPSDKTIALKVGKSPGHVQRCLRQLEAAGYIDREHTPEVPSGRRIRLRWRGPDGDTGARPLTTPARGRGSAPARSERVVVEQGGVEQEVRLVPERPRPGPRPKPPMPASADPMAPAPDPVRTVAARTAPVPSETASSPASGPPPPPSSTARVRAREAVS